MQKRTLNGCEVFRFSRCTGQKSHLQKHKDILTITTKNLIIVGFVFFLEKSKWNRTENEWVCYCWSFDPLIPNIRNPSNKTYLFRNHIRSSKTWEFWMRSSIFLFSEMWSRLPVHSDYSGLFGFEGGRVSVLLSHQCRVTAQRMQRAGRVTHTDQFKALRARMQLNPTHLASGWDSRIQIWRWNPEENVHVNPSLQKHAL